MYCWESGTENDGICERVAVSHSGGKTWQRLSPVLPGAQQWESVGNSSMRKGNAAISISLLADLLEPGSEHPAWLLT